MGMSSNFAGGHDGVRSVAKGKEKLSARCTGEKTEVRTVQLLRHFDRKGGRTPVFGGRQKGREGKSKISA